MILISKGSPLLTHESMRSADISQWKRGSYLPGRPVARKIAFLDKIEKFAFLQTPRSLLTRGFDHLFRLMFKAAIQILLQQSATESIRAGES